MSGHANDESLLGFIDAEVSQARATEIERHLERCPECLARCRTLRDASNGIADLWLAAGVAPADVVASRRRIGDTMRADIDRRRTRRAPMVLALTAALLFFMVRYESTLLHRSLFIERGALPIASFTPGLARALEMEELCGTGIRTLPDVPAALRAQVLRDYGMEHVPPTEYELDYLITPELGGLTDRRNLWPEPYGLRSWNAHAKDVLEHRLPQLVCRGEIDLATAQRAIASNWIGAYRKYLPAEQPMELHARVLEFSHSRLPIAD
ncbi:MAG: hypothetical protein EHM55_07775 [Acidobacteria bacterium]|nr:MAG: hypothetical protein EHM55_07775 [Acidobacteriota bacterium]